MKSEISQLIPLFADDTVLSISGSNSTELQNIVNTGLGKGNEWLRFNKLSLNYSKTSCMIVSCKNNQLIYFNVRRNNKTITQTTCVKYLGIFIDDKLTWSNHIAYLEKKLCRSVRIFYRIRQNLSHSSLKSLYFSFIYSHLKFAIGAWDGVGTTTLNQLNVLPGLFSRKMLSSLTGMNLWGPDFSDSRDPIFKSRNPNRVPKTP